MTKTPEELTEEWKTRSLPSGWYYIKIEGFKGVDIDLHDKEGNSWLCNSDKDLNPLNVIAPVPSYDEYKAMQEQLNKEGTWYTEISYKKIKKENNNLHGLLKECKQHLYFQKKINNEIITLLVRINVALGESEE